MSVSLLGILSNDSANLLGCFAVTGISLGLLTTFRCYTAILGSCAVVVTCTRLGNNLTLSLSWNVQRSKVFAELWRYIVKALVGAMVKLTEEDHTDDGDTDRRTNLLDGVQDT